MTIPARTAEVRAELEDGWQIAADMMRKDTILAETVRNTAYFLWEHDGRPEGRSFEYWLRAKEMHQRQLAYDKWLAEGAPPDRAAAHWEQAEKQIAEK